MRLRELGRFEERTPGGLKADLLSRLYFWQGCHLFALLDNIWTHGVLPVLMGLVAVDDHESGPIQVAVVLEQLVLVNQ